MKAYYRDFGMVPPGEPEGGPPHLQLQVIEGQETLPGRMLVSNSVVESRYAVPGLGWREATLLERRQLGQPVVSIGGIGPVGSSRGEMQAAIRQTRAEQATEARIGNLLERFVSKIEEGPGCWEWTGARDSTGRGVMRVGRALWGAHRLAYAFYFGDPPPSPLIQNCGNVACVRREHLLDVLEAVA